ncbi:hypothetical protein GJ496_002202 [Pomphorhynchus laevis]|nr:hypothetical protein GJ496_002202 [Pomphorhynchus laevis]
MKLRSSRIIEAKKEHSTITSSNKPYLIRMFAEENCDHASMRKYFKRLKRRYLLERYELYDQCMQVNPIATNILMNSRIRVLSTNSRADKITALELCKRCVQHTMEKGSIKSPRVRAKLKATSVSLNSGILEFIDNLSDNNKENVPSVMKCDSMKM